VVTLFGVDHYLGKYGSAESKRKYDALIAEYLANNRQPPPPPPDQITVAELAQRFRRHVESYHKPKEAEKYRYAIRYVRRLCGHLRTVDFTPKRLKAARDAMVADGLARSTVNARVARVRAMFTWGVEEELVPAAIPQALAAVKGLRRGKTTAPEMERVKPADEGAIRDTMPFLPPVVQVMVQVQRLSGMRPGELVQMTPGAIDRSQDPWIYWPKRHKNLERGQEREVYLGPRCQELLTPFLLRPDTMPLFIPRESERRRRALASERRKTPLSCGNTPGSNRVHHPKRQPGESYCAKTYNRAIQRAILRANEEREKAGEPLLVKWTANMLRHSKATETRASYGLEAVQATLGHARMETSEIYAEHNRSLAQRIARETA